MRGDFFAIGLVVETLGIDRLFLSEIMVSCFSDVTSEKSHLCPAVRSANSRTNRYRQNIFQFVQFCPFNSGVRSVGEVIQQSHVHS